MVTEQQFTGRLTRKHPLSLETNSEGRAAPYVYATADRRARCLSHDDKAPQPFELVASFEEEDTEQAWALLHEARRQPDSGLISGGQAVLPSAAGVCSSGPSCSGDNAAGVSRQRKPRHSRSVRRCTASPPA